MGFIGASFGYYKRGYEYPKNLLLTRKADQMDS